MVMVWFGNVKVESLVWFGPILRKKTFLIFKTKSLYQLNFSSFRTSETGNKDCTEDVELSKYVTN